MDDDGHVGKSNVHVTRPTGAQNVVATHDSPDESEPDGDTELAVPSVGVAVVVVVDVERSNATSDVSGARIDDADDANEPRTLLRRSVMAVIVNVVVVDVVVARARVSVVALSSWTGAS